MINKILLSYYLIILLTCYGRQLWVCNGSVKRLATPAKLILTADALLITCSADNDRLLIRICSTDLI